MKEVVFLSTEGGAGKASIVVSVMSLAQDKVVVDSDVDTTTLQPVLGAIVQEKHEFLGRQLALIDQTKCFQCGLCLTLCQFEAIEGFYVDPSACEGCGLCFRLCPFSAISLRDNLVGHWFVSETRYGKLVHARLGVARGNTGKLVTLIREKAGSIAQDSALDLIVNNGPPGSGPPVIASLVGADLAVIIVEPVLYALDNLQRVLSVCRSCGVEVLVCINKYDLYEKGSRQIEDYCRHRGIKTAGRIPFDIVVAEAMVKGLPVVEYSQNGVGQEIEKLWQSVCENLAL